MVDHFRNGQDSGVDFVENQTGKNVQEAVDMMIDATLKIMDEAGGDASKADKGPVLHDLVCMFDDRVVQAESEGALPERVAALREGRDRAAERYHGETGLVWQRRTE